MVGIPVVVIMIEKLSQMVPVQLGGHIHLNVLPLTWHVPPFLHGFKEQALTIFKCQ
jgi:hypothetical protein